MTLADQDVPVIGWNEPDGLIPRGTVIVIPGRGELPALYERFGRRLAADAYRILAGLPATPQAGPAASWEEELDARTFCPTHRGRLTASAVRRGALYEPIPADWLERADLDGLGLPILGIHGGDDPISPLGRVRDRYAAAPSAELVRITAGLARRAQRPDTPDGGRRRRTVPGTDPAGLGPAPDCGPGATGTMMNGPGAAVRAARYGGWVVGAGRDPHLPGSSRSCPGPGCACRNLSEVCFICAKPSLGTGKSG